MIDLKCLRENSAFIKQSASAKGTDVDVTRILELDQITRSLRQELQYIATTKNEASKRIVNATQEEKEQILLNMRSIDSKADEIKERLTPLEQELEDILYSIPNPALEDVKVSADENENEIIKIVGKPTHFSFDPKDHLELAEALDIVDMQRAAKVSGARFAYFKGDGVLLELALIQYALTTLVEEGFIPILTPHLINPNAMRAMGYLEHGGHDEIYYLQKDNAYLIGTSEQSIGPMHMDEILDLNTGPLRYVGISPCYRREAGSYGKDTKGILRVHQFNKLEMFIFCKPEDSDAEHNRILDIEQRLMQGLKLPYRVVKMVTGDLGLPAARKYDIETWIPSQQTYRETHSCSTCTDFQARRLQTRYKDEEGKTQFVHTLNGTAFAIGRILIAILENYQNIDGTVNIPDILKPWMKGKEKLVQQN